MSHNQYDSNQRAEFDHEIQAIADYVLHTEIKSPEAYETAQYCLMDSLGCAMLALNYPACTKLLGPIVDHTYVPHGTRIPGTMYQVDPVLGAFNIGMLIRWLDFNDTWLAAEWGHPSDNLGGILAVADYLSRLHRSGAEEIADITMYDVLTAMIKAHEIQGIMALENSFNRVGLDHVVLVKLATCAVVAKLLGATRDQLLNAISLVWVDGQSLRTYRHAPNTGSRKSWAAGDATSRGVQLALFARRSEMGYSSALTAKTWGFYDVSFRGEQFRLQRPFDSYVMENVLFKIAYPAEFHAQTAVECAIQLHPQIINHLNDIERIEIETQESAVRIISKAGPLHNPADRDHCLQYMIAIGLLHGELTANHYEDEIANDLRIDELRNKMTVQENKQFSKNYLDPDKRSIANAITIYFKDGTATPRICIEYPLGHRRRRKEGIPVLIEKCRTNLLTQFEEPKVEQLISLMLDQTALNKMSAQEFMRLWVKD